MYSEENGCGGYPLDNTSMMSHPSASYDMNPYWNTPLQPNPYVLPQAPTMTSRLVVTGVLAYQLHSFLIMR